MRAAEPSMPLLVRARGFRFFGCANEGDPHVRLRRDGGGDVALRV